MKTAVIKMGELTPVAAGARVYPVRLLLYDGKPDWLDRPLAVNNIPEDLSIPNPPLDPVTGNPLDGQLIRDEFLKEADASDRFEAWGSYLHQLLFRGAIAQEWDKLRDSDDPAAVAPAALRTILDIRPAELRWLPWELIYQAPMPWFFDAGNPFSRGTLDAKPKGQFSFWPIHALIVVGSAKGDPAVSAEREIEAIQHAFIKSPVPIDWYISCRPTKDELQALINNFKPHILHFIGHGRNPGYPYLELTDKEEKEEKRKAPEEWTVPEIGIHLQHWKPRLVFINACRSSSPTGQENSWDIARAFAAVGVSAVIGMQADIKGVAAAAFSGRFYESLPTTLLVDRSLAEARAAVSNHPDIGIKRRDWALATLYLQQLPEQIFDMRPAIDKNTLNKFKIDSELKKTSDFVGRRLQRRKLWYGVDQISGRDEEFSSLCIVVGSESTGKTALVQASMKICALRNRKVSYVDVGYQSTKNFVDILKIIRSGDPKTSDIICASLPEQPFAEFDEKHGALLKQPNAAFTLAADKNLCDQFFEAYKAALIEISAAEPLIIVLDHLNVEWDQFNNILAEKLIIPIAQNLVGNCRMILVCTADDLAKRVDQKLKDAACLIEVSAWKPEKFVPLARQICLYNNIKLDEKTEQLIKTYSERIDSDWKPAKLRYLVGLLNP